MRIRWFAGLAGACVMTAVVGLGAAGAEEGRKLYEQKCASCHGPDGKGLREKVEKLFKKQIPDFTATDLSKLAGPDRQKRELELRKKIVEAQPPMSSFTKTLTPEQQDVVFEYVKQAFMNGAR